MYRAVLNADNGFAKTVAVKRLLPTWGGNDELREMLIDEARALTHLQHQAIVQVLELGSEEGTTFIAMEFVDGINCATLLKKTIRDRSPLAAAQTLYIIGQVLLALEFAHRCEDADGQPLKIVHRDISPSNILLSYNGEVKVTDFGIAKGMHRTRLSTVGQLKGKYAYMAPEQARGEPVDARADLFACGVVLYELLTARHLFDAPTDLEVLERVKQASLPDGALDELPASIHPIIMRALARDRKDRYPRAAQMLEDIRQAARSMDALSSNLELANYLRNIFPIKRRCGSRSPPPAEGKHTRVLKGRTQSNKHRARFGLLGRTFGIALLLAVIAPISPSRGKDGSPKATPKEAILAAGPTAQNPHGPIINNNPPAVKRNARLSVHARPWGTVTVAGYTKRRETPLKRLKVKPGAHLVQVLHPPSGRTVQRRVRLSEGQTKSCLAIFSERPALTCR